MTHPTPPSAAEYDAALAWLWDQTPADERVRLCSALAATRIKRENLAARLVLDHLIVRCELSDDVDPVAVAVATGDTITLNRAWVEAQDQGTLTAVLAHEIGHMLAAAIHREDERLLAPAAVDVEINEGSEP